MCAPPRVTVLERSNNDARKSEREVCYNCNRPGHIARRCRQPRRPRGPTTADPEKAEIEPEVVTNHTTQE